MKLRSSHLIFAVIFLLCGFVIAVTLRTRGHVAPSQASEGNLPPVGSDSDAVPRIELEATAMNLGLIPNDDYGRDHLTIYNRGKEPLEIKDITTSCACTLGQLAEKDRKIAPGGEVEMEVLVNPFRIRGFHSKKVLTINSNDPHSPSVTVSVEAEVTPEYEIEPRELEFGTLEKGTAASKRLLFRQLQEERITIEKLEPFIPGELGVQPGTLTFSVEERPQHEWKDPEKVEYWLQVNLGEDLPAGALQRYFVIASNLKRLPEYFPIRAQIQAPYEVSPTIVPLVLASGVALREAAATVSAEAPVQVDKLEYDSQLLEARVEQSPDTPNAAKIVLSPGPGTPPEGDAAAKGALVKFQVLLGEQSYAEGIVVRWVDTTDMLSGDGPE